MESLLRHRYLNKSRTFVINQCKKEISVCCSLLRSKRTSDKQLLYVYNMVIIPRLEYLTQITILTAKECRQIITPFRILFKHKLQMDKMTPNAILNNPLIYNFRDFYEVQLQSKLNNFAVQLNQQSLMQRVALFRLKQLQTQECLEVLPTITWNSTVIHEHFTHFIAGMLTLGKKHGFSFITPPEYINRIRPHSLTIRNLF